MTETVNNFSRTAFDVIKDYICNVTVIDDRHPSYDLKVEEADTEDIYHVELFSNLYNTIIDSNMSYCGIRYSDDIKTHAKETAKKSELLIQDWDLEKDDGLFAIEIISELRNIGIRFLCIYSNQRNSHYIRGRLEDDLAEITVGTDDDFVMGNIVVSIRSKPGSGLEGGKELTPEKFVDELLSTYVQQYGGFLQLSLLELTTRHRETLPKMLSKIDDKMDLPFLIETTIEDSPLCTDGVFLRRLLIDEWRTELENSISTVPLKVLSPSGITSFTKSLINIITDDLVNMAKSCFQLIAGATSGSSYVDSFDGWDIADWKPKIEEWLESGLDMTKLPMPVGRQCPDTKLNLLACSYLFAILNSGLLLNDEGSIFSTFLRLDELLFRSEIPSSITQGSVLKLEGSDKFLICITPLCDAVRPDKINYIYNFLSATANKHLTKTEWQYCVIRDTETDEIIPLNVEKKVLVSIKITEEEIRKPTLKGKFLIPDEAEEREFKLVAQLRKDQALKIAAAAAEDTSRIGIDRVEVIRKKTRGESEV